MAILHNFECQAHGVFEASVAAGTVPWCPQGCSPAFVQLVILKAPLVSNERFRVANKLVRQMADLQGLSDIDVSPSSPGDSVADKNYRKLHPDQRARAGNFSDYMAGLSHRSNELTNAGFGNRYNPQEWMTDRKSGVRWHVASPPREPLPSVPTEMTRVRERP